MLQDHEVFTTQEIGSRLRSHTNFSSLHSASERLEKDCVSLTTGILELGGGTVIKLQNCDLEVTSIPRASEGVRKYNCGDRE